MYKKEYETIEISSEKTRKSTFTVAVESKIRLNINNKNIATILASPEQLEQLAVGYLICDGIIDDMNDIKDITINSTNINSIDINCLISSNIDLHPDENVNVESNTYFDPDIIKRSLNYLESKIYHQTRGTHAACIIDKNGFCIAKAIDIGRHNAVDKAIGQALIDDFRLDEHFIISTGRQPAGMILKAARAGLPMVVTKTAPLNTGIEVAQRSGICLIGLATESSMIVFSHKKRISSLR